MVQALFQLQIICRAKPDRSKNQVQNLSLILNPFGVVPNLILTYCLFALFLHNPKINPYPLLPHATLHSRGELICPCA